MANDWKEQLAHWRDSIYDKELAKPDFLLYRHYDSENTLLYVGITGRRSKQRLKEHFDNGAVWMKTLQHSTYEHFPSHKKAHWAEKHAIWTEEPLHNMQRYRKLISHKYFEKKLLEAQPYFELSLGCHISKKETYTISDWFRHWCIKFYCQQDIAMYGLQYSPIPENQFFGIAGNILKGIKENNIECYSSTDSDEKRNSFKLSKLCKFVTDHDPYHYSEGDNGIKYKNWFNEP